PLPVPCCCLARSVCLSAVPSFAHTAGFARLALGHSLLHLRTRTIQHRPVARPPLDRPWLLPSGPLPQPFSCQCRQDLLGRLLVLLWPSRAQRLPVGLYLLQRRLETDLPRRQRLRTGRAAPLPAGPLAGLARPLVQHRLGHHLSEQVVAQDV